MLLRCLDVLVRVVVLIILVVVLLIFGPKNLPKLGKMFGKTINGFKKGMEDEDAEPFLTLRYA